MATQQHDLSDNNTFFMFPEALDHLPTAVRPRPKQSSLYLIMPGDTMTYRGNSRTFGDNLSEPIMFVT